MNTETGKVYEGDEVEKARARGEKLVPVSRRVFHTTKEARAMKAEQLRNRRKKNRKRDRMQRSSRKKNR